jgi:hypothetical protein
MKKHGLIWEFPHSCVFSVFSNGKDSIYWVDPDGFRKKCYFLVVDETGEIIGELSFPKFYQKIDYLIENGWNSIGCFISNTKCWVADFAMEHKISLTGGLGMSYREEQRKWAEGLLNDFFKDPGNGKLNGKEYPFVLQNAHLNLWEGIRADALSYFSNNNIPWWESDSYSPAGHLLSSQVACVNHLYPLRQRQDLATALLKNIDRDIISAERLDDGFVEFEIIGQKNYLTERQHTRGANATSIDAVMLGKKPRKNILVLIEWKYTENYDGTCLYGTEKYHPRPDTYNPLLEESKCPINKDVAQINALEPFKALYYEPYYQLMRQTLLGWKMADANEYGADDYIHLHVVPDKNHEMLSPVTSKELQHIKNRTGDEPVDMQDAWESILKDDSKYRRISPQLFFNPLKEEKDTESLLQYLNWRYWQ